MTGKEQKSSHYDLIVVGSGSGGLGATGIARALGLKSLLIEATKERIGGDCLNYGCVPSKALIHVARIAHAAEEAKKFGLDVDGHADFAKALAHVHEAQARIREHENAEYLREHEGQELVIGWARFASKTSVRVGENEYSAQRIILATGSRPRQLEVPGVEQVQGLHTNHTFFAEQRPLPERLLIVGGGAIGCEMGQTMQRLGSQVTIVDRGERILAKELPDFSQRMERVFRTEGVKIMHESEVTSFSKPNTALVKTSQGVQELEFDEVLIAIGRDESIKDMDLEKAGIETDEHGVLKVNNYYETTNRHVFAIGDAMGREKFSHAAEMHNRDLVRNMLVPLDKRHSLENFSWVTFTDPEVATFGLTADQLEERNIDFQTIEQPFTNDDRAITAGYADIGKLVLYVQRKGLLRRKHLLGGSMIAPGAGEMIQELILAKQAGLSLQSIFNKVYPYPVASRINQKAVMEHRKKLSEKLQRPIAWWWRV